MPTQISGDTGVSQIQDGVVQSSDLASEAVTPAKLSQKLTLTASQNTTSGTFIDFTGIPSWAKRVTLLLQGVSTNGSSFLRVQIGSGSIDTSGYLSTNGTIGPASVSGAGTASWDIIVASSSSTVSGRAVITLLGGNIYIFDALTSALATVNTCITAGHKTALSGPLDRVRLTTANGTDTFDAGTVSIMYEG